MKVYFLLSYDTVFKPRLLFDVLSSLGDEFEVVGVAEVTAPKKKKNKKSIGKSGNGASALSFWGLWGVAWLAFMVILNKACSALPVPSFIRSRSTIKRVAKSFNVPWELVENVNAPGYIKTMQARDIDILVSFQHQIFKRDLLSLPRVSCLNCHPGALPKYRGVKPIFWAMLDEEVANGVTVHTMEPAIDAGRIISQKSFPINKAIPLMDHYYRAYSVAAMVILEGLDTVKKHHDQGLSFDGFTQISTSEKYYKAPDIDTLNQFKAGGYKTI